MSHQRAGYLLSIIGGWLAFIVGALLFLGTLASSSLWFIFGLWYLVVGLLMIAGAIKIKNKKTVRKGAIIVLVGSILGGGQVLGLIGAILILIDKK